MMHAAIARATLVLTRQDVVRLLDIGGCVEAVERAFRLHAAGGTIPSDVLSAHVDGASFHVKTAGLLAGLSGDRRVFAAKVNANVPENPARRGRPTIQGVIVLFDAETGRPSRRASGGKFAAARRRPARRYVRHTT